MIYVIGMGIRGKESLSRRSLGVIEGAVVMAGGKRHLEEFPFVMAEKVLIKGDLDAVFNAVETALRKRPAKDAVFLATGDPLLFGIGEGVLRRFGRARVSVVPNVSVVQEAFSRIKICADNVKVVSVHGKDRGIKDALAAIDGQEKTAVFTDPENSPAKVARALQAGQGPKDSYDAFVCESLGAKDERVKRYSLSVLAKIRRFAALNVLILIRKKMPAARAGGADARPLLGIPDACFSHAKGMITKEELRVIALSKLRLKSGSTLWDIGAGSGSISVEASFLAYAGLVYAIEKDEKRIRHIERNIRGFRAANIEVIHGKAPACLVGLRPPDAVFLGGGGEDITAILRRGGRAIKKNGRIVVNAVTLETAGWAVGFFKENKWPFEVVLVNLSRAASNKMPGAGPFMFRANNPVFIITGEKS